MIAVTSAGPVFTHPAELCLMYSAPLCARSAMDKSTDPNSRELKEQTSPVASPAPPYPPIPKRDSQPPYPRTCASFDPAETHTY